MISSLSPPRLTTRRVTAFAVAALLMASCGSGSEPGADAAGSTTAAPSSTSSTTAAGSDTTLAEAAAPSSGRFALPTTNVLDVADRSEVNLSTIAGDKPILLWFYAPH